MLGQANAANVVAGNVKADLNRHIDDYQFTFKKNEFYMDKTSGEMATV